MAKWLRGIFVQGAGAYDDGPWRPAADVGRTRDGWLVKLDLAGVRPEDLSVSLSGRKLSIRGVRRDAFASETCGHYMMEIAYNRFERCLELPEDLEGARLSSEHRDGMLVIRIQKEESKP